VTDIITLTVTDLVDGVIARLTAKISGYAIEPFPDKLEQYKLNHQRGAFLVAYRGADYDETEDTGATVQVRRPQVDIAVQSRALNGAGGSYAMLEMARAALVGHQIPGFTQLAAVRERFIGRNENVWTYQMTFSTTTLAVQLDDDVVDVLLAQLTFVGPSHTLEIPHV
jgi:hypothetical protein